MYEQNSCPDLSYSETERPYFDVGLPSQRALYKLQALPKQHGNAFFRDRENSLKEESTREDKGFGRNI